MLTKVVSTRHSKDSDPIETRITLDFDGCTQEQMESMAGATAIINEQAVWRLGTIPKECVVKVVEQFSRVRAPFVPTPQNMMAKASKMSSEQKLELLKKLQAELSQ